MKLGLRRPLTSFALGAACLCLRLTLEPARWVPRIAATSADHSISILSRAPRAARPYPLSGGLAEVAVDIVHPRVAGIDVHKKVIWVAVRLPGQAPGERKVVAKSFKTFWRSLQKMAAWLTELGVTDAAMESTGVYWGPVYHALAGAGVEGSG